jgi:hypothetical protein
MAARAGERRSVHGLMAALGLTLGPLCFLVLPVLMEPGSYETPAAALAAAAEQPALLVYGALLVQLLGAVLILPAIGGIVHVLRRRQRAVRLGYVSGGLALLGAFSAMTLIGMELAQARILEVGEDQRAMVDLALAIQDGAVFGTFLITALLGLFGGVVGFLVSLWRARVVPVWTLASFAVPVAVGLLPLPGELGQPLVALALMVPFVWASWLLLRRWPALDEAAV